jgi:ABC-2 type transport system permease protein
MKQSWTVLKFEYKNFVKSGSFIAMTVIFILVGLIGPSIPTIGNLSGTGIMGSLSGEGDTLALVDTSGRVTVDVYNEYMNNPVEFFPSLDAAKAAMENGSVTYAVNISDYDFTLYVPSMKLSVYNIQSQLSRMMRRLYQLSEFNALGLDTEQADTILTYAPAGEIVAVGVSDTADDYQQNIIYAYAMIFILYFGLIMCGQYVLTTVIREKSTKTMELLITSCKSDHLINGKVVGVALAAMTQISLLALAAAASMRINGSLMAGIEEVFVVDIRPDMIILMVVFFLLGIFAYAYMYAGLASTVSRMEDANNAAGIPMMLIMFSFFAAMGGLMAPGAAWVTVLSYIPFFTPMVMFTRICLGTAAAWEIALSIGIQLATIILTGWLGGRIYRMGTLMYGNKINYKDMMAAIKG